MTQYLLSRWHADHEVVYPDDETMQRAVAQTDAFNTELQSAGGLRAKEQIGGFRVIEEVDLDAALSWAGRGSAACMNPVEVRPFQGE